MLLRPDLLFLRYLLCTTYLLLQRIESCLDFVDLAQGGKRTGPVLNMSDFIDVATVFVVSALFRVHCTCKQGPDTLNSLATLCPTAAKSSEEVKSPRDRCHFPSAFRGQILTAPRPVRYDRRLTTTGSL